MGHRKEDYPRLQLPEISPHRTSPIDARLDSPRLARGVFSKSAVHNFRLDNEYSGSSEGDVATHSGGRHSPYESPRLARLQVPRGASPVSHINKSYEHESGHLNGKSSPKNRHEHRQPYSSEKNHHRGRYGGNYNDAMDGFLFSARSRGFFENGLSAVGVRFMVMRDASWYRRALWSLLVMFGFGFMIYQFYERVQYFTTNPSSVNIEETYEDSLVFPTVTICNENQIDYNRAFLFPGFGELIPQMYPPFPDPQFVPDFTTARVAFQNLAAQNITWDKIWEQVSPSYQFSNVYECIYNNKECDSSNKLEIVPTSMGYCYQFNGVGGNSTTTRAGQFYGFSIILDTQSANYYYSISRAYGFRVLLHGKTERPLMEQLGFRVPAGAVTSVAVRLKTVTQLPAPYSNCSDASGYEFKKCTDNCMNEYIISQCGCRYYFDNTSLQVPVCDPEQQYVCADVAVETFINQKLGQRCNCPQQCTNDYYTTSVTSAPVSDFASNTITTLYCNNYGIDCANNATARELVMKSVIKNYCEIQIFFDQLLHEKKTTEPAYSVLALLCDIGGALGLILGATVLTLFEIIDFLVTSLWDCGKYKGLSRKGGV